MWSVFCGANVEIDFFKSLSIFNFDVMIFKLT